MSRFCGKICVVRLPLRADINMKSIREIYRIGRGPSSSHSMGPAAACELAKKETPQADSFKVKLYGSLALKGKGHQTDEAVINALRPTHAEVEFDTVTENIPHPNTMDIMAIKDGKVISTMRVISVGGGAISVLGRSEHDTPDIYEHTTFSDIIAYCKSNNLSLPEYIEMVEGKGIWNYLHDVWRAMKKSIDEGLAASGTLPGGIGVQRKAQYLYNQRHIDESDVTRENRLVCAYAFAVAEQNASGGIIVTAPTCGACGVIPAALRYNQQKRRFSDDDIVKALGVGGLIGNLIKTNASISGAECGCQAEIGSACSMCAAALAQLYEMGLDQIEYAAEVAMEHHLGLTCDPVAGLVQIPCIERNAVASMRAINALSLANFLTDTRKISFDLVIKTMYQTGLDMQNHYKETSQGGLAKHYEHDGC